MERLRPGEKHDVALPSGGFDNAGFDFACFDTNVYVFTNVIRELLRTSVEGKERMRAASRPDVETMIDAASAQWLRSHQGINGRAASGYQGIAGLAIAGPAVAGLDLGIR